MQKKYEEHELASLLPLLEEEDFEALVEDIKKYGQIEPITLYEGKILDGRNRYRACQELGIEVKVKEWKPSESIGLTPLQYVVSENIMRRHLNIAQRSEIGLILLEEEEKLAKERQGERSDIQRLNVEEGKKGFQPKSSDDSPETSEGGTSGQINPEVEIGSVSRVAPKVKVSPTTLKKAKFITDISKSNKEVKEEWEKAKKGEQGVDAVYQIAKEVRDDQKRIENVRKYRETQKRKEEMDKLNLQIREITKIINELENAKKLSKAKLKVISEEVFNLYPQFETTDPDFIITKLSLYYDNLDVKACDHELAKIKEKYDSLKKPLIQQIEKLEAEFQDKKEAIDRQKEEINKESLIIENYENLLQTEFGKIEIYDKNIEDNVHLDIRCDRCNAQLKYVNMLRIEEEYYNIGNDCYEEILRRLSKIRKQSLHIIRLAVEGAYNKKRIRDFKRKVKELDKNRINKFDPDYSRFLELKWDFENNNLPDSFKQEFNRLKEKFDKKAA